MMNKAIGRRPGASRSREAILEAARARFATHGYDATTMRAVAADAGVDAALVSYFFKGKEGLFAAAVALPITPADVLGEAITGDLDGLGDRLVRRFLTIWDDEANRTPMLGLVRSAAAHQPSAAALREFIGSELMGRLVPRLEGEQPELRATLIGSQVVGLLIQRHVIELEPLASASHDEIAAWVGPTLQRYVHGEFPHAEKSPI